MSTDTEQRPVTDPMVVLLVATAVGFVEAGILDEGVTRLRDFASGEPETLERARGLAHLWPSISPDARAGALRLLTLAAAH